MACSPVSFCAKYKGISLDKVQGEGLTNYFIKCIRQDSNGFLWLYRRITRCEIIRIGKLELRFFLDVDDTNNQMVVFESVFPGGAEVMLFPHKQVDEMVYGGRNLTVKLDRKNSTGNIK